MKILTLEQLRAAEQAALAAEQISNLDLMQRAAKTFADWVAEQFPAGEYQWLSFLCGSGNNGGDGLAAARILSEMGYGVEVFIYRLQRETEDFLDQYEALKASGEVEITEILSLADLPVFDEREIIVDALLGSGLNRPLEGELAEIVEAINQCPNIILALDCPTAYKPNNLRLAVAFRPIIPSVLRPLALLLCSPIIMIGWASFIFALLACRRSLLPICQRIIIM